MADVCGYCGLECQTCPIYLATRQADRQEQARMRAEILRLCNVQYGSKYVLEDITDCDGCNSVGGRLFPACKDCPIRICASERQLESCAFCPKYACGKLMTFFEKEPGAERRLEKMRTHPAD